MTNYSKAENGRLNLVAVNFNKKTMRYGGVIKPSLLAQIAEPEHEKRNRLIKDMIGE
jgi:hypothetical protein